MKGLNLNRKFIIWFLGILAGLFLLVFVSVRVVIYLVFEREIYTKITQAQAETDSLVADIFYEATHLYSAFLTGSSDGLERASDIDSTYEQAHESFLDAMSSVTVNSEIFANIAFLSGGRTFMSHEGYDMPPLYGLTTQGRPSNSMHIGPIVSGCLTLYKTIRSPSINYEGVMVFYINEEIIAQLLKSIIEPYDGSAYLMTSEYYIFSGTDKDMLGRSVYERSAFPINKLPYSGVTRYDGAKKIMVISPAVTLMTRYNEQCYFVSMLSYNSALKPFVILEVLLTIIAAMIFVAAAFAAAARARKLSSPINKLNSTIRKVIQTGRKSALSSGGDEIRQLEQSYDEMIERIFALMEKTKEDMEVQRKLELDALQMQMNTHFLFNTLDAIGWYAKLKKQHEIEWLVINLAKFFRLSLHAGDKFVKVSEEIEIIKHFVEIEKICYPDKFTIDYNIANELASYMSLKLILQPVVENSVKHGLSELESGGHISIDVYGAGDDIIYQVTDNGVGFDPDTAPKKDSYGLRNINERILLEYGEGYGLTITSQPGKGTQTKIRIAKRL